MDAFEVSNSTQSPLDLFNRTLNPLNETAQQQGKWGIYFINYTWRLTFAILHLCGAFAAITLNGGVILAMFKGSALQDTSCRILCGLSITDFFTGISGLFNFSEAIVTKMQILGVIVTMRYTANVITLQSSILFAAFISYDRYLHMSCLQSKWKMPKMICNAGIAFTWSVSIITAVLVNIVSNQAIWLLPSLFCLSTFIIVIVSYVLLLKSLRGFTKVSSNGTSLDTQYLKNEKYATRTIAIITTFFIGMNIPILCGILVRSGTGLNTPLAKFNAIGVFLSFSNSVVNPLVYCIRTRSIRRDMMSLLPKSFRNKVHPES